MEVRVRVRTNERKETVAMGSKEVLAIGVREPAKDNKANTRVREIVAERYGVPLSRVRILSGHRRPNKIIRIT